MPIKKNKIGAKKKQPAQQSSNPVQALFSGVAKAEVTQGVPRLERAGEYLLALESCNVAYTQKDSKPYIKILATIAHVFSGTDTHEAGDTVSLAIFKSLYFDKEVKTFIMKAFNLEDEQVTDDFVYGVAGYDEEGNDTGEQVVAGVAIRVKVVLKPSKKEGQSAFPNVYFQEALPADEVLELVGDEDDFNALFPDGVTYYPPQEEGEETED
jgi:hypothetical protein